MLEFIKQNIGVILFVVMTINFILLTAAEFDVTYSRQQDRSGGYEIIQCADGAGKIHTCIRVDPNGGEVTSTGTGAHYRVIYGR